MSTEINQNNERRGAIDQIPNHKLVDRDMYEFSSETSKGVNSQQNSQKYLTPLINKSKVSSDFQKKRMKKGCCATFKYIILGKKEYEQTNILPAKRTSQESSNDDIEQTNLKKQKVQSDISSQDKSSKFYHKKFNQQLDSRDQENLRVQDNQASELGAMIERMKTREKELLEQIERIQIVNQNQDKVIQEINQKQGSQKQQQSESNSQKVLQNQYSQRINLPIESQMSFKVPVAAANMIKLPNASCNQSDGGGVDNNQSLFYPPNPEDVQQRPRSSQQQKRNPFKQQQLEQVQEEISSQSKEKSNSNLNRPKQQTFAFYKAKQDFQPNPNRFALNQSLPSQTSHSSDKFQHLQPTKNPFRDYVNRRQYLNQYYSGPPIYTPSSQTSLQKTQPVVQKLQQMRNGQQQQPKQKDEVNKDLLNLESQTQQQSQQITSSQQVKQCFIENSQDRIDLTDHIQDAAAVLQRKPQDPSPAPQTAVFFKAPTASKNSIFKPMAPKVVEDQGQNGTKDTNAHPFMNFMANINAQKQQSNDQNQLKSDKNGEGKENQNGNGEIEIKRQIAFQNKEIIDKQKEMKKVMSSDMGLLTKTFKEPIRKNQNYTVVPNNSQVSERHSQVPVSDVLKKSLFGSANGAGKQDIGEKSGVNQWTFTEGFDIPDEDERDDLNLTGVNTGILKDLAARNKATINDIFNSKASVMKRMAFKIRTQFDFLRNPVKVLSVQEVLTDEAWNSFNNAYAARIASGNVEAVALFSSPQLTRSTVQDLNHVEMQQIDLILITNEKICKISFTSQESAVLWSDSSENGAITPNGDDNVTPDKGFKKSNDALENRVKAIYHMMNGKFETTAKPKGLFGNGTNLGFVSQPAFMTQQKPEEKAGKEVKEIAEPERARDTILVKSQQPLFALYAFVRYYLCQTKYKAIIKYNLNHKAYFSKRDAIVKLVQQQNLEQYWAACILSLVCV